MQIIKLDATASTNAYLKNLLLQEGAEDFTVVQAFTQTEGRGQMGTIWVSEPGKNLTFSVLKKHQTLMARNQFNMNLVTSIAVYRALKQLHIPDLAVKWPNDILSGTSKICGILIENITSGNLIQASILGIGINVNQRDFGNLKQVSSLQLLLGRPLDLDEVLRGVLEQIKEAFEELEKLPLSSIRASYEELLFRKDRPSTFRNPEGSLFMGFIRGVSEDGKLQIALEDEQLKEFDLKEVQLLF